MKKTGNLFTSSLEKHMWLCAGAVFVAIFSTLFMGKPLAYQLRDQNVQAVFFVTGMLLVAAAVISHSIRTRPAKIELSTLLGIIAVYTMFIFRLGAPERSHLIEYSVLTVFLHKAFVERAKQRKLLGSSAFLGWLVTVLVGVLDESIQLFLPNRVFDYQDILFNGLAATMAIGATLLLAWVRKRYEHSKKGT